VIAMSYEQIAKIAQQGGSLYFFVIFLGAVAYAFWPGNRAKFTAAKHQLLDEGDADV
jgi:cytochrome c oxidase cbb3-type subunit 4